MNDFDFWLNEVADMPTRDEKGRWFDLETGLYYKPEVPKKKKTVKITRDGLFGSEKQIAWALEIKKNILNLIKNKKCLDVIKKEDCQIVEKVKEAKILIMFGRKCNEMTLQITLNSLKKNS